MQICYRERFCGKFTSREFIVLNTLISKPNIIFSRDILMDKIGTSHNYSDRLIDNHIKKIRIKLMKINPELRVSIETVNGAGYKFNPDKLAA